MANPRSTKPAGKPQAAKARAKSAAPAAAAKDKKADAATGAAKATAMDSQTPVELKAPDAKGDSAKGDSTKVAPAKPEAVPATKSVTSAASPDKTQRSGFVPMMLGGIVAAGLGYGAAYYAPQAETDTSDILQRVAGHDERLTQVSAELRDAEARLAETEARHVDPDLMINFSDRLNGAEVQLADLGEKLAALAARPSMSAEGGIPAGELQAVLDALAAQRAENVAMADELRQIGAAARKQVQEAEARATALEAQTMASVQSSQARAALTRLQIALDGGGSYAAVLGELDGVDIPQGLLQSADSGVLSLATLQRRFPPAAREALLAARKAAEGEGTLERLGAFVQSQVGARSLEAKDGTDPDAVLSRAEAALREGRLNLVFEELAQLAPEAQTAMSSWTTDARARQAALAALETLATTLNNI